MRSNRLRPRPQHQGKIIESIFLILALCFCLPTLLFGNWFVAKYSKYATSPVAQAHTNKPSTDQAVDSGPADSHHNPGSATTHDDAQPNSDEPFDPLRELPKGNVTAPMDTVGTQSEYDFSAVERPDNFAPENRAVAEEPNFEFELPTPIEAVERTWTTTNGRQATATLVRLDGPVVILMRDDKQFKIPLNVLSDDDLLYVNSLR